jgi:hypothetical protein
VGVWEKLLLERRGESGRLRARLSSRAWRFPVRLNFGCGGFVVLRATDCLERLLDDVRERRAGSERLAMALVVRSRARAARLSRAVRLTRDVAVKEAVDWRLRAML